MDSVRMTAARAAGLIRSGDLKSAEYLDAFLKAISDREREVGAFLTIDRAAAMRAAEETDRSASAGKARGRLCGVPVAVKDNICTAGMRTTCGSRILENFIPFYDAHVVKRIREEGGIVLGKTNMDEFAMGSSTENSALGVTRNPRDLSRVPGGSSGGSAAAVAAGMAPLALGSETGGSVRQPASLCGVVGLKPTYGRVSRYGLVAFASSLDQIGPLAACVEDAALLLGVTAGRDSKDSTSSEEEVPDYAASLDDPICGLRLGVPREYLGECLKGDGRDSFDRAVGLFRDMGAEIVDVSLPHTRYVISTYCIIATAEASSNLARYDGMRYGLRTGEDDLEDLVSSSRTDGFGPEVKRRIILGTFVLGSGYYDAFYLKARKARTLIREDFSKAFGESRLDAMLTPASPVPAFRFGEKAGNPLEMYLCDVFTAAVNLAGNCAISVPSFPAPASPPLPLGLQIIGDAFREQVILRIARAFEKAMEAKS